MMPRNAKLTALVLATVFIAGCANAKQDFTRKPGFQVKTPRAQIDPRRVKDVKTPKIRPETHLAAGRMFESRGQSRKALAQYRKAASINSRNVVAYHRLGLLASRVGSHDEAIKAFRRAVTLRPKDATLRNNLGFELLATERFEEAQGELAKAVKLDPTFARAHVNLGMLHCKLGRFDDGLDSFLTVLPEADAFYNLGLMYRGQKRYVEAARAFRQVLVLEPAFTAAVTQIEKMKEHMSRATPTRPAPKFAARTVGTRPRKTVKPPRRSQPAVPKRDAKPTTKIDPTAQSRDDSKPWDNTFAMLDKAISSNATVDALPMTESPPGRPNGDLRHQMTALTEIADNERDCVMEEADLRAQAMQRELNAMNAMAWAVDAGPIACEAIDVCDADDVMLAAMNRDDFALQVSYNDDTPVSWLSEADHPSRAEELQRLLQLDAPISAHLVAMEATASPADPGWDDDAWIGTYTSLASYTVPVQATLIAQDMTEWDLVPLRPTEKIVSSVDSRALLRTLADELAVVRNEIDCVDQTAQLVSATDRRLRQEIAVPARSNTLVGPPAALAIPATQPAAILASQPSQAGSSRNKARSGTKQRGNKVRNKRNRRTSTSQATPMQKESQTADLRGALGHEPTRRPN